MQVRTDHLQDYRARTYYDGLNNAPKQQDFSQFQSTGEQEVPRVEAPEKVEKTDPNVSQLAAEMTGIGQRINIQV